MAATTPPIDGRDLGLAFQATAVLRDRVLARYGRSFPEAAGLRVLIEGGFTSREAYAAALGRGLALDAAAVDALIAGLDAAGFVHAADPVTVTPAGEAVFRELMAAFSEVTAAVYAGIDPAAIETTRTVLQAVRARAEALAAAQQ